MRVKMDNILSYDWVYLRETKDYNDRNIAKYYSDKQYRIISFNRRGNRKRYLYCCYIHTDHRKKRIFSYLGHVFEDIDNDLFTRKELQEFNGMLPRIIDDINPKWHVVDDILSYIERSYFLVIFETNCESRDSKAEQISEKAYRGIKTGRPFLIFTSKGGILNHLKSLDFKSFAPNIIEEYDNPSLSYNERFELLLKETDRLCNMSKPELEEIYRHLENIVVHNLKTLKSKKNIPNLLAHMATQPTGIM